MNLLFIYGSGNVKLKWCIGSTGMVGKKAIPDGLLMAENCELLAVQGRNMNILTPLAKKWGVKGYTSVIEMLYENKCDAVYIGSPQNVHLEHVEACASRGYHIVCEKPLARNSEEVLEMISICNKYGVRLGTAFNNRFQQLNLIAKKLIAEGKIGKVISARCQFGQDLTPSVGAFRQLKELAGGGAMIDMGNHCIDLIEFITGKKFKSVLSVSQEIPAYEYEVEDVCAAILEFEDSGIGIVDTYYCCPFKLLRNDLEINGTKGTIHTIGTIGMHSGGQLVVRTQEKTEIYDFNGKDMYCAEFEAFAEAFMNKSELPCSEKDGLHSQILVNACYKSGITGTRVGVGDY